MVSGCLLYSRTAFQKVNQMCRFMAVLSGRAQ